MSVPSRPALIWPAAITTPIGPAPDTVAQSLSAAIHGPLGGGSDTADFNAEGVVQKGYSLNPFAGKFSDTIIKEGQMVFCHRGDPSPGAPHANGTKFSADSTPHTIVSLPMINMILQDEYDEAMAALHAYADHNKGQPGTGLLKYLTKDEACWASLFADSGKTIRADHVFKHYYYLCKQGIRTRWNYLGVSILASAPDAQTRGEFAYLPLNVAFKGVRKYMANLFGLNAGQCANGFLVLKRRRHPMTGDWGAFAFHPYATNEAQVPLSFRAYQGVSGAVEFADVIPIGRVRDTYRNTLPPERLAIAQGLASDSTPAKEQTVSKQVPTLDFAIHAGLCYVVEAFA